MFLIAATAVVILNACLFNHVESYDLCAREKQNLCAKNQLHISKDCIVETTNFTTRECSTVPFSGSEKLKNNLGLIKLQAQLTGSFALNISFQDVTFKKAYLKLSVYNHTKDQFVCKMLSVGAQIDMPIRSMYDLCFWQLQPFQQSHVFLLEFKAERKNDVAYRKILFTTPNITNTSDRPVGNRPIFFYIDYTDSYIILLRIQTHRYSNVANYKIEVFREKDRKSQVVDVRLVPPSPDEDEVTFECITFNEQGYYYFAISEVSAECPEDACGKTYTPKVYVDRKGTPLVIGIVGASLIIPLVMYLFYMWNCRSKEIDDSSLKQKVLFVYKSSSQLHSNVVTTLAKLVKDLCDIEVVLDRLDLRRGKKSQEKWCNDHLYLATHIVYIAPPKWDHSITDLDFATYTGLKDESMKSIPEQDFIVLFFGYSGREIPSIFDNALEYVLLEDFQKFIKLFEPDVEDYQNNSYYVDLLRRIKAAQCETDSKKYVVVPEIIITEQSDCYEANEPNEADGLL